MHGIDKQVRDTKARRKERSYEGNNEKKLEKNNKKHIEKCGEGF